MDKYHGVQRAAILENLARVRRFAYALSGTPHDADDLLQATVERVLAKGAPEDADVARWMFRVCKNIWLDELRARRVRVTAVHEGKLGLVESFDGEIAIIDQLTLDQVNAAMARLPDEQRLILSLVALDGCSYREAAEILEVPIGTVMSRLARARRALAAQLEAGSKSTDGAIGDAGATHHRL